VSSTDGAASADDPNDAANRERTTAKVAEIPTLLPFNENNGLTGPPSCGI